MLPGRKYTPETILATLWKRRWLIVGPLFVGTMGGLLYSRSQRDVYMSDAVVQVVPQRVPDSYVQSTVTERVDQRLRSLSQEAMSRTQLEAVIVELDLYPEERARAPMEDVVALMARRVQIEPIVNRRAQRGDPTVDSFRIAFEHHDPRIAQRVVERLATYFINENAKERGNQAEQTSQFLEAQLADARSRLEAQEKKLEAFRERNSGSLPTQTQTNMQAIQNAQMALQANVESLARDRDRKMMLERLYQEAAADLNTMAMSGPALAGTPGQNRGPNDAAATVPANAPPQQRLEAARSALSQLELRLKPEHPDVVRTKRLIRDLERQVAAEESQRPLSDEPAPARQVSQAEQVQRERVRQMRAEIESLDRQIAFKEAEEQRLRSQLGLYQGRLEAVPGIESEWISLTRDYDTLQETYRELLSKSENSKLSASLEQRQIGEQFRVVDPPRVPLRPVSPNRLQINGIGAFAGLALGILILGFLEYRDSSMRTEADVIGALALPVLAMVPYVSNAGERARQRRWNMVFASTVGGAFVVALGLVWTLQLWKFVV